MLPRLPVGRIPRLGGFATGGRSGPGASPGELIPDRGAECRKVAGMAAGGRFCPVTTCSSTTFPPVLLERLADAARNEAAFGLPQLEPGRVPVAWLTGELRYVT
jgi:hypothetical protein